MRGLEELENEYENYMYMASGLMQEHQQSVRFELLNKAEAIKEEIKETEKFLCAQYNKNKVRYV